LDWWQVQIRILTVEGAFKCSVAKRVLKANADANERGSWLKLGVSSAAGSWRVQQPGGKLRTQKKKAA